MAKTKPPKKIKCDALTASVLQRLIDLRDHNSMSNVGLARASNQTPQEVSRFMLGQMTFPALGFLDALCRVFRITLADVLNENAPTHSLTQKQQRWLTKLDTMPADDYIALEHWAFRDEKDQRPGRGR